MFHAIAHIYYPVEKISQDFQDEEQDSNTLHKRLNIQEIVTKRGRNMEGMERESELRNEKVNAASLLLTALEKKLVE